MTEANAALRPSAAQYAAIAILSKDSLRSRMKEPSVGSWDKVATATMLAHYSPKRRIKNSIKVIPTLPGFRRRMLAYLAHQGVGFATEPTNALLWKLCAQKLGLVHTPDSPNGLKEMLAHLPELPKVKKPRKRKPRPSFYASNAWKAARYKALKASDGKCALCGDKDRLHVDHIKPRSKFPELALEPTNLQVLCETCNMGKSNKDDTDWRAGKDSPTSM